MSLRLRLTLITTVVLGIVLAVFGAGVYVLLDRNLKSRLDQTLEQRTLSVARSMGGFGSALEGLGLLPPGIYLQIIDTQGAIADKSPALGNEQLPLDDGVRAVAAGRRESFTYDAQVGQYPLRVRAVGLVRSGTREPAGALLVATSRQEVEDTLRRLRGVL
ncbi:MAG: hypothetical protein WAT66_06540, partial [Actinomycetota bacterium]